jgi:hypothetical protein
MNLREEILKEQNKIQTVRLAQWVCTDRRRLKTLMKLFFQDEQPVVSRAAWVLRYVAKQEPDWLLPYLKKMLWYCRRSSHASVKRNVTGLLQEVPIPRPIQGLAATVCFELLTSPSEPVAVKVFSMGVITRLSKEEPGLRNELISIIEDRMEFETPAFRARAKKILTQSFAI